MDNKYIAVAIAAVLVVAGIGAVFVLNKDSDSKDDASLCDTWYATYVEYVRLDTLDISKNHYMMEEKKVPLTITSDKNSIIQGKWGELDVYGVVFEDSFTFEVNEYPFDTGQIYPCYADARMIDDRLIINCSLYDSECTRTVGAVSMQYTRQGTTPVGLIDMVKYNKTYTPDKVASYTEASIIEGKAIPGFDVCPELEFVKGDDMISVFKVFNDESYFVFMSSGYTSDGKALGMMIGECHYEGTDHYVLGIVMFSNNTLYISYELDIGTDDAYVSTYTYKVDYDKGEYVTMDIPNGTFESKGKVFRSETDIEDIDVNMTIKTVGTAIYIYSDVTTGDKQLKLLGTINGDYSQGTVIAPHEGYYGAQIHKDRIQITGVTYLNDDTTAMFKCEIRF